MTRRKTDDIIIKQSRRGLWKSKYAEVAELADALDSGSSEHYVHGGSSPPSRTKLSLDVIHVLGSVFYFAFLPTLMAGIFCNANPNLRWAIRGRRFFFILKLCAHVWGAYLFCNMNQKRVGQNKRRPFLLIPGGFAGFRKRFWEDFCCRCPSSKFRNWYLKRNSYADFSARRFRFFIFSIFSTAELIEVCGGFISIYELRRKQIKADFGARLSKKSYRSMEMLSLFSG